ncbi:MAG: aldose epimerase family protein [Rudaea sp.]|uniref:aldose epimerase family protein n=1 Tax=Rudaea sp. TaxID=2136325 RepID=UPI0039E24073
MPITRRSFGRLKDGRNVDSVLLSDAHSGFSVEVLEYGATIRAINVPAANGQSINTVLAYRTLAEYENGNAYLGATIGRCAGRTAADAHAQLHLSRNEGSNHLHGGKTGFSHSLWRIVGIDDGDVPRVCLRHRSPADEDGYPGDLTIDAEFSLTDALTLRVVMQAHGDADTPLNLTLHPYFNLDGDSTAAIDDHVLRIDASNILPLGPTRLPTGERMAVAETPFDFRMPRAIGAARYDGHAQLRLTDGYDHYYVLDGNAALAAEVYSPRSSLGLRIGTNQAGLQFYSGNHLDKTSPTAFRARSGFCLEPHAFPNAINEPRFPDITLRAGEIYRYETRYEFCRTDRIAGSMR